MNGFVGFFYAFLALFVNPCHESRYRRCFQITVGIQLKLKKKKSW